MGSAWRAQEGLSGSTAPLPPSLMGFLSGFRLSPFRKGASMLGIWEAGPSPTVKPLTH